MKRKLLTFLMSLIMVAPLAGCGERNMSSNPKENEAKIVLRFAEIKPGTANEIVENQSELQYHYSDCAELSGEGFYTTGDVARITINYNNKACAFSGWVIDGLKRGSSSNLTLGINSGNAGKTINIYALMGKNGNAPQLDNSTLTIRMNSISVTSFDGQVYKLNQGKVVIPTNVIYEYDSTIEGFKNGSTNYTISDDKVTINEIEYQVNYDLTDPEKVAGLTAIDSDNKVYKLDANNKVTVVEDYEYEYDSSIGSNGGFKRGSNTYSITTNNVAQLENVAYSVLKDGNTVTGLTELGNNVGETTTALQPADLETYKLPAAPGEEVISFAQMINKLQETTYQQGITLASLFPGTNLSYYTIPVGGKDTLQHYKITWKAAEGSCGGTATVIDPATFQFRSGVANYCLSAHIDMRAGLTDTYIESAIKSTLLNQMYVYENANSTCANAIKGNVTVNNGCMFVRNIALLGDVIYQTTSEATAKGHKLFYYGVAEGNNGELRLESVEHDLEGLFYKSQTTQGSSSWKNPIKTSYVIANREEYALQIEEVYDALKHYYQNPRDAVGKVSFGLSRFTNEVVINSMEYGGKTYYFNYVDDASTMAYYYADNKITQTTGIKTGVIHKLTPFVTETENLTSDQTLLNQLEAKIRKNPENLFGATSAFSALQSNLMAVINGLVNTAEYKDLRKYEFSVSKNPTSGSIEVTYRNRIISLNQNYKFADDGENIELISYDTENNKYAVTGSINFNMPINYNLNTMLNLLNILSNPSELTGVDLRISSYTADDTEYVEYSIYSGDSLIVKLRNESGQSKYELMNNFDQNKVEFEVTLKEGIKEETLFNGKVEGIKLNGYDMVELKTSHNETLYKLVKVTIGDSDYYIDIINKEVYNSNGTSVAPVRSNIGTAFTYYFEITEDNYYAIHTDAENSVTGVQKISINEGSATLVESVIECSKNDGGNKEIYVAFNGAYYLVDFTNPEEPKIVVGEDSYVLNTEYANHYEITTNNVEVIGISGSMEDSPIYKLYQALIDTNTEYYSVGEDKVAVKNGTTYVLSGGTDRVYEVTYENMVYRVTFNEPVVENTPENPGEVEDSPTGEEE